MRGSYYWENNSMARSHVSGCLAKWNLADCLEMHVLNNDEMQCKTPNARKKFLNFIKGWHVYGLVQRAYRKYEEAIKCYRNALKFDKVCTT